MTGAERFEVDPQDWWSAHEAHLANGRLFFDLLLATDLGDGSFEVVTHVMAADASQRVLTRTTLTDSVGDVAIASIAQLYPASAWYEREAHDLVGIDFIGNPDLRALVFDGPNDPLVRTAPLAPRIHSPWPGSYEPGAQPGTTRRKRPKPVPGVNPEWKLTGGADDTLS